MTVGTNKKEMWWLAKGSSSFSRQPSFAPPTARPSVTTGFYHFGWNRTTSSFVTRSTYNLLTPAYCKEYPCERAVALCMIWQCVRRLQQYDAEWDTFTAAGTMCAISSRPCDGEICLHFYSPTWKLQRISLHCGMSTSFMSHIKNLSAVQIHKNLQ
jgi:hypothetical protein